jgi:hypothetical protein
VLRALGKSMAFGCHGYAERRLDPASVASKTVFVDVKPEQGLLRCSQLLSNITFRA